MKPTQEQVIAWAREAGLMDIGVYGLQRLVTIAYEAGRKDENEACAKVCESLNEDFDSAFVEGCIEHIRARREQ